jgi:hypothetical protein
MLHLSIFAKYHGTSNGQGIFIQIATQIRNNYRLTIIANDIAAPDSNFPGLPVP